MTTTPAAQAVLDAAVDYATSPGADPDGAARLLDASRHLARSLEQTPDPVSPASTTLEHQWGVRLAFDAQGSALIEGPVGSVDDARDLVQLVVSEGRDAVIVVHRTVTTITTTWTEVPA